MLEETPYLLTERRIGLYGVRDFDVSGSGSPDTEGSEKYWGHREEWYLVGTVSSKELTRANCAQERAWRQPTPPKGRKLTTSSSKAFFTKSFWTLIGKIVVLNRFGYQ
jgi:hypothetical protein